MNIKQNKTNWWNSLFHYDSRCHLPLTLPLWPLSDAGDCRYWEGKTSIRLLDGMHHYWTKENKQMKITLLLRSDHRHHRPPTFPSQPNWDATLSPWACVAMNININMEEASTSSTIIVIRHSPLCWLCPSFLFCPPSHRNPECEEGWLSIVRDGY